LVECLFATPFFEAFGEQLSDSRTTVQILVVEIGVEFGLQLIRHACRDRSHTVYFVCIVYKRFGG
jgi:hypothetical protein